MFGTDLKNTLTTIFGAMGALAGAILTLQQMGVVLPAWVFTMGAVLGAIAVAGIGFLTGKNADGSTKTAAQVAIQTGEKENAVLPNEPKKP